LPTFYVPVVPSTGVSANVDKLYEGTSERKEGKKLDNCCTCVTVAISCRWEVDLKCRQAELKHISISCFITDTSGFTDSVSYTAYNNIITEFR